METLIKLNWKEFKAIIDQKKMPFYIHEDSDLYQIIAFDGGFTYECVIVKSTRINGLELREFETNYKNLAAQYEDKTNSLLHNVLEENKKTNVNFKRLDVLNFIKKGVDDIFEEMTRYKAIYAAGISSFSAASSPTDIFSIIGSDKKIIKIKRFEITPSSSTSITAIAAQIQLIKRSTLNTGGTSTALTIVPFDSNFNAARAQVKYYTANPSSLGTSVGVIRSTSANLLLSLNTSRITWEFKDPVILRRSIENLSVNLNGVSITSNSFAINVEWEEA